MKKLCFIDLETTGFDGAKNGLVQISGGIEIPEQKIFLPFNWKVCTFNNDVIEDEALKVTGFTREEIAGFDPPRKVYRDLTDMFKEFVDKYNRLDKFHMVGYNNQAFDSPFLREWFKKNDDVYFGSWFWYPHVDVMLIAAHVLQDERTSLPNFKLATVCRYLGIPVDDEKLHDAFYDIELTRALYWKLEQRR